MRNFVVFTLILVTAFGVLGVSAQDDMMDTPMVNVSDQLSLDGTVTIDSVYSDGPGFVVIHIDNEGSFGAVAGHAAVPAGHSHNVKVDIDTSMATPVLYAMLHTDTGEVGTYEFGQVEGADGPVVADGAPISPPFNATIVDADDQFVTDGTVTINSVVYPEAGWLVIHSGDASGPGPVLGSAPVEAGTNTDVVVTLEGDATNVLWPMLHTDTGEAGVYEFGQVEGADGPVRVNDRTATFPIWTVPHMRISNQAVSHGDNYPGADMMGEAPLVLTADSVLSDGPGWLVIHVDQNGSFGPVAGSAALADGLNEDVVVELADMEMLTTTLWPMLHTDTGEVGVYEFGEVEGADGPVAVDGDVVVFAIDTAPYIGTEGATYDNGTLTLPSALIDHSGWLVIHSAGDSGPGPVIGFVPLRAGLNTDVTVELDPAEAGSLVYPMLHYDTGEAGVYEFGEVEGADGPVRVNDSVVVLPLDLGS